MGLIKITGTIDHICFYKLEEEYYARSKSTLDGKKVKRDTAFKETMKNARLLAKASVIGSLAYRLLPKEKKGRKIYQQLTGKAMKMLRNGVKEDDILQQLHALSDSIPLE